MPSASPWPAAGPCGSAPATLRGLGELEQELLGFRVLDPACGCGNFLYIAYRELRRLERRLVDKRLALFRREQQRARGMGQLAFVRTEQFYGIDINPFAVEIAKVTLMLARQLAAEELGDEQRLLPHRRQSSRFCSADNPGRPICAIGHLP
jgi:hypothetical protein